MKHLPAIVAECMKNVMKDTLNAGEAFLDQKKFVSFKSLVMFSVYANIRTVMRELSILDVCEKSDCGCRIENSKCDVCQGTEYVESEKFKKVFRET